MTLAVPVVIWENKENAWGSICQPVANHGICNSQHTMHHITCLRYSGTIPPALMAATKLHMVWMLISALRTMMLRAAQMCTPNKPTRLAVKGIGMCLCTYNALAS